MALEGQTGPEQVELDPTPLDISERVRTLLDNPNAMQRIDGQNQLLRELSNRKTVTLTLDYTTLNHANLVRAFLNHEPRGAQWTFSIRATELQMREAPNVFNSGVEWIQTPG